MANSISGKSSASLSDYDLLYFGDQSHAHGLDPSTLSSLARQSQSVSIFFTRCSVAFLQQGDEIKSMLRLIPVQGRIYLPSSSSLLVCMLQLASLIRYGLHPWLSLCFN